MHAFCSRLWKIPVATRPSPIVPIVRRNNTQARFYGESAKIVYPTYPKFNGKFVIIGWGTVAKASLHMIINHLVPRANITVITADETDKQVAINEGLKFISQPVTTENIRSLLGPHVNPGTFLLNLSVDVSSVELAKFAQEQGCLYMDTCIEPAAGGYTSGTLADRTNYMQREKALALKPKYGKGTPTTLFAHGINPGLISSILKQAIINIANDTQFSYTTPTTREQWADLMHRLGIRVVHIAERDTQVPRNAKKTNEFYNTWSVEGFISEGIFQSAELGWGTHERELPADALKHSVGSGAAIYLTRPGASTRVRTWTPIEGPFHGFLVTHNESVSISEYFSVKDNQGKVIFRPTVHYAYHPSDSAVQSVHEILGKDSEKQQTLKVLMDEIVDGHDELGVLVMGHSRGAYWYGSVVDVHEARSLVPYNNATSLQVAAGVLAGVVHCIEHPKEGVIEAEDMDHTRAIEVARPYLGRIVGKYTDWTPIKNYKPLFPRPVDLTDPWQFKNFRVV